MSHAKTALVRTVGRKGGLFFPISPKGNRASLNPDRALPPKQIIERIQGRTYRLTDFGFWVDPSCVPLCR